MTDPKDPHSDEHIEDLLSQLQGIFGKLSQSEEEESQKKEDPPPKTPVPETPPSLPMAPVMDPSPSGAPPFERSEPPPVYVAPPVETIPLTPIEPPPNATPEIPAPPVVMEPAPTPAVEAPIEALPPIEEDGAVPTVIYYPSGREPESKVLAQKLETMAPKFTKVAFVLRVTASVPYDLKSEPRDTIVNESLKQHVRAVFFVVERPLDDVRKKAMAAQLEPRGIYFQEVPVLSIEKKAFYTDLLLGLVFFFDSLKSPGSRNEG